MAKECVWTTCKSAIGSTSGCWGSCVVGEPLAKEGGDEPLEVVVGGCDSLTARGEEVEAEEVAVDARDGFFQIVDLVFY